MCYSRYIEYALRIIALNADGTDHSWLHIYLFNAEWEASPRIPFSEHNILLGVAV